MGVHDLLQALHSIPDIHIACVQGREPKSQGVRRSVVPHYSPFYQSLPKATRFEFAQSGTADHPGCRGHENRSTEWAAGHSGKAVNFVCFQLESACYSDGLAKVRYRPREHLHDWVAALVAQADLAATMCRISGRLELEAMLPTLLHCTTFGGEISPPRRQTHCCQLVCELEV